MQGDWTMTAVAEAPRSRRMHCAVPSAPAVRVQPDAKGHIAAPRAWMAWLGIALAATALYFRASEDAQSILYDGIGLAAAAAMAAGVVWRRLQPRPAWILVAASVLTFSVGDMVYGTFALVPSVADMFYLSGHLTLAAALFLVMRGTLPRSQRPALVDAVVIVSAIMAATLVFLNSVNTSTSAASEAVSIAYPAGDLVVLGLAVRLALASKTGAARFRLLVGAVLLMFAADAGYALQGFGSSYALGGGLDAGWLLSYALFGAALLHPGARTRHPQRGHLHQADAFVPSSGTVVLHVVRLRGVLGWGGVISMGVSSISVLLGTAWKAPEAMFLGGVYGTAGLLMVLSSVTRYPGR